MSGATPELPGLIGEAIASALSAVYVHAPAKVVSYDSTKRVCVVQPLTRRPVLAADDDAVEYEDDPTQVPNVPVLFIGGGALSLTWDLEAGDVVLLLYLDYSPSGWRQRGAVSDAGDTRKNGPSYPVALPWYRPGGAAGERDPGASIGRPAGPRIRFTETIVQVGEGTHTAASAELIAAELTKIATVLNGLAGPGSYIPEPVGCALLKSD